MSSIASTVKQVAELAWLPALFIAGLSAASMAIVAEFPPTQDVSAAFTRSSGDGLGGRAPRMATPADFPIAEPSEMSNVRWMRAPGLFAGEGQPDPHDPDLPYAIFVGEPSMGYGACGNARF